MAILAVLRNLGVDPVEVLTEAGVDPRLFDDPDNLITYRARGRLMALAVARTGCRHFGLLVGRRMSLQSLGLVGLLARNAPDVAAALRSIVTSLHLHSRGAVMGLTADDSVAVLTYDAFQHAVEATDQTGDGAVAMMVNVMTTLCGARFRAVEARFAHHVPEDVTPFRQFFKVPLRFDAEQYALVFSRPWLDVRLRDADPELQRLLRKQAQALEAEHRDDFAEQVRRVLRSAILTSQSGADQIAALFSMHTRTLARRLDESGTSFQTLVDEVCFETARQMLEVTSLDVGQIAEALGYARASAFARAFRRWSGTTPVGWRSKRAGRR